MEHGDTRSPAAKPLAHVEQALQGLRYGTVTLVVHDGAVVQIDRAERIRLEREESAP